MLNIDNGYIAGEEIHKVIESKNKNYSDWVRKRIVDADLQKNKDFFAKNLKSTGGRPRIELLFTLDAAKEICLLERNEKGKQLRRWLISLSKQKEDGDLLNHEQVIYLNLLKSFFRYVENQKDYEKKHLEKYIEESNKYNSRLKKSLNKNL